MRNVDFKNCNWPEKYGRNILFDEIKLFGENKDIFKGSLYEILINGWCGFKKDIACDKNEIKKVELLYRRLKQKYTDEHDWPEVSNWHYGEKEMFRRSNLWRRFFPLSISNLYWLSSGYGERPVRAGGTLVCLVFGISFLCT